MSMQPNYFDNKGWCKVTPTLIDSLSNQIKYLKNGNY